MISALIAFALILTPIVVGLIGARFCAINTRCEIEEQERERARQGDAIRRPLPRPYKPGTAR